MTARDEIMARIRTALSDVPAGEEPDDVPVPRDYLPSHATDGIVDLFAERVADYKATVVRTDAVHVSEVVALVLSSHKITSLVVPAGFPESWLPPDLNLDIVVLSDQPPLASAELEQAGGVITTAALGIAITGTIVLDAGPGQGRRAISLLPDYHLCVIRADQITADVPAALAALDPARPLTFISGPSATSDIELNRVEGVHGPRTLDVIVVGATAPANGVLP